MWKLCDNFVGLTAEDYVFAVQGHCEGPQTHIKALLIDNFLGFILLFFVLFFAVEVGKEKLSEYPLEAKSFAHLPHPPFNQLGLDSSSDFMMVLFLEVGDRCHLLRPFHLTHWNLRANRRFCRLSLHLEFAFYRIPHFIFFLFLLSFVCAFAHKRAFPLHLLNHDMLFGFWGVFAEHSAEDWDLFPAGVEPFLDRLGYLVYGRDQVDSETAPDQEG